MISDEHTVSRWIPLILSITINALVLYAIESYSFNTNNKQKPKPLSVVVDTASKTQEPQYVETNPNHSTDTPPETNNFSSRNQLAAQTVPNDLPQSESPTIDGQREDFQSLTDFQDVKNQDPVLSAPQKREIIESIQPKNQITLTEKPESPILDDSGSGISNNATDFSKKELTLDAPQKPIIPRINQEKQLQTPKPKPRPKLRKSLSPLRRRTYTQTHMISDIGVDAQFRQFGSYIDRLREAVNYQSAMLSLNLTPAAIGPSGEVRLFFILDKEGQVHNMQVIGSTASPLAESLAMDTILSLAPFDPWTDAMIASMGSHKPIYYVFYIAL